MAAILDRVVVTTVVAVGTAFTLLFAALLVLGPNLITDPRNQCDTKIYSGIRVCDRLK